MVANHLSYILLYGDLKSFSFLVQSFVSSLYILWPAIKSYLPANEQEKAIPHFSDIWKSFACEISMNSGSEQLSSLTNYTYLVPTHCCHSEGYLLVYNVSNPVIKCACLKLQSSNIHPYLEKKTLNLELL